jgi:long-chain-fatty-acid--CoA ligase ACSBG
VAGVIVFMLLPVYSLGRIKELIITAGGENIPPVLIENEMKAAMLALSNVMVIGDKRKFLSMLVSLKVDVDGETGVPTNKLATDSLFVGGQIGSSATTTEEAAKCPKWEKYINDGMKAANAKTTSNVRRDACHCYHSDGLLLLGNCI